MSLTIPRLANCELSRASARAPSSSESGSMVKRKLASIACLLRGSRPRWSKGGFDRYHLEHASSKDTDNPEDM